MDRVDTQVIGLQDGFVVRRDEFELMIEKIMTFMKAKREYLTLPPPLKRKPADITDAEREQEAHRKEVSAQTLELRSMITDIGIRSLWPSQSHLAAVDPRGMIGNDDYSRGKFNDERLRVIEST